MANANFAFDTAANWASNNRTPLLDEVCFESDGLRFKVGNGSTAYNSLPYYRSGANAYSLPSGAYAESFPRATAATAAAIAASGVAKLVAVPHAAGQLSTSVTFQAGGTGGATLTHSWAALCDLTGTVLAVSADNTAATWTASSSRTYVWGSTYRPTAAGDLYVALMVAGGTIPTLISTTTNATLPSILPLLVATAGSGQTTPPSLGASLGALTVSSNVPYFWLS